MRRLHANQSFPFVLALLALGWHAGAAAAFAPQVTSDGASPRELALAEEDARAGDTSRELRRVLQLAGGGFIRAKSRRVGENWEYQDGAKWRTLDAARILDVALERDLLKEARRLEQAAGDDVAHRAAYAAWLCDAGLLEEGVDELDRVLAREPDCDAALATCVDLADFLRISAADPRSDAGLAEWLRVGAASGRALREIAVHQLGERSDEPTLRERLALELSRGTPRTRAFAALALRRLAPGAELRALSSRAVLDGSDDVRREAALALKAAGEPAVVAPLVRALGSQHAAVRANAVAALSVVNQPAAIEPLIDYLAAVTSAQGGGGWRPSGGYVFFGKQTAYVQDYDVEVAQFAAVADPQVNVLNEGVVLDVRVISTFSINAAAEARRVRAALQSLTQADPGDTAVAWREWFAANRARLEGSAPKTAANS
ncbi:MAG: HEAT repeat domain-containing protein [Planctomycetes bacterium]|nr:HEAT repeat domain-containing protein [Planctomycetota bacterium]